MRGFSVVLIACLLSGCIVIPTAPSESTRVAADRPESPGIAPTRIVERVRSQNLFAPFTPEGSQTVAWRETWTYWIVRPDGSRQRLPLKKHGWFGLGIHGVEGTDKWVAVDWLKLKRGEGRLILISDERLLDRRYIRFDTGLRDSSHWLSFEDGNRVIRYTSEGVSRSIAVVGEAFVADDEEPESPR